MNKIFLLMCVTAISVLLFTAPDKTLPAVLSGSEKAFSLTLQMAAIYAVWLGFLNILEETGATKKLAKLLRPLIRFLFGDISEETAGFISLNMSANFLGMGGAATPMGLAAMERLNKREDSFDLITMFFVLNASSLQLLSTSVLSLRVSHGSASPADIILPIFLSSLFCTAVGVALVKLFSKKRTKSLQAVSKKAAFSDAKTEGGKS